MLVASVDRVIDSTSATAGQARHRARDEQAAGPRDAGAHARRRLRALMDDAEDGNVGTASTPSTATPESRSSWFSAAAADRLGRFARRWLPESWRHARVDPGRAGCLGVGLLTLLVTAAIVVATLSSRPKSTSVPALPVVASTTTSAAPSTTPSRLVISMVGRVHEPGLVTVPPGARVADALDAAGGPLPDTNILPLNLARELADGEQLYVGVPVPPGARAPAASAQDGSSRAPTRKIDLNTADEQALEELPGVGPVTAKRIVRWREDNDGFDSVEQLRAVNGIGDVKFSKLSDRVRV